MAIINVEDWLAFDEGRRRDPYYDSEGYPTIGIGHLLLNQKGADLARWQPIDDSEIDRLFEEDRAKALDGCRAIFGEGFDAFADARQAAFINMCFQLGEAGLRAFRNMIAAARQNDWAAASAQARQSLWYNQVPERADRVIAVLNVGDWTPLANLNLS